MAYVRPVNNMPLSKQKKVDLLKEYAAYYRDAVAADDTALNRKIPRDAFIGLLDRIGSLLIDESARLATAPGPVRDFLADNPLPTEMAPLLPDSFRAFCLALQSGRSQSRMGARVVRCATCGEHVNARRRSEARAAKRL